MNGPQDDAVLLEKPELVEGELEEMAKKAIEVMRELLYLHPWV